jgi:hypothetical protein
VTVTDDNDCEVECEVIITEPDELACEIIDVEHVLCYGEATGEATVVASGGTPPYTYLWSDGQTTAIASGLSAGTYTVTVTDDNDCEVECEVIITEPEEALACEIIDVEHVLCYGEATGEATVVASGGTPPYTYLWSDGQTTATATGLSAGTYTVTVTDANDCEVECEVIITEPEEALACEIIDVEHVLCYGEATGSATVVASGGTPPYTYLWSDGQTTATATGLSAGTYTVTVTDDNDCEVECEVIITEPEEALACEIIDVEHVLCFGEDTGEATVVASGGTPPYTYLWSDGQTTATATGLSAGTYTVTVTDDNDCEVECEVIITEPEEALACEIIDVEHVLCYGEATGEATVVASGGTPPYTYLWSDGQTTATATGLSAGTYTVTVTDDNDCEVECEVIITEPEEALACEIIDVEHVLCYGEATGSATVVASGGTPPYTYLWSDGQTTATATGLSAGTYTVTVTDDNDCEVECEVIITEPEEALACEIIDVEHVLCFGEDTGEATVVASGGTPPYTYLWSDGQTTATATGLSAGTYTVTVTDANDCEVECEVIITEPEEALACEIIDVEHVLCYGEATGEATVVASGGTPPYTYLWSDGQTTATASGLSAGTYTVTVTDDNDCEVECEVIITEPEEALACEIIDVEHVLCFGEATGEATVVASGGTPPYSYLWDDPMAQTTATATGLSAGTYTVTVTDDNDCEVECEVIITEPEEALACEIIDVEHVLCYGEATGEATVVASGGTPPYTYLWSDGQTTATASGLSAGTYTVTVTDDNDCEVECEVIITEPEEALACEIIDVEHVLCFGEATGEATVVASGGTPPYSYLWDDPMAQTTATATGLSAGTYTVTVTDDNDCEVECEVIITEPEEALACEIIDVEHVLCYGEATGEATVVASGGTPPYTYLWSDGQTTATATGLSAGTYTVTVTDDNDCEVECEVIITEPEEALACEIIDVEHVLCFGEATGEATVVASGGTPPYTYLWSDGQTTATATGLSAGTYTVTVTDDNDCEVECEVIITEPEEALACEIIDVEHVLCYGEATGEATVVASGGTPPYTYLWSDGQTTATATGLSAGTYTVTVTDDNDCEVECEVIITEPEEALACEIIDVEHVLCFGEATGEATVVASGGTPPYSYLWDDPMAQTTATATGLSAGTYTVTVTDDNDCEVECEVIITEPEEALACEIIDVEHVLCYGEATGEATVVASGGTPPYTYLWSDGQTTATASGLSAGTYTVTVTDDNDCEVECEVIITEPEEALACEIIDVEHVLCFGEATGEATVVASGGTPPYSYLWDDPMAQTTATATGLSAGTYTVTVTDDNDCEVECEVIITEPEEALACEIIDVEHVLCYGEATGSATVVASGGTPPYTYLWSDGQTTATATGLSAGTYTVTVTDDNDCEVECEVIITEPEELVCAIEDVEHVSCYGEADGQATVVASGGTPPYSYLWSDGQTTATATGLSAGTYTVTVTDANDCETECEVEILEPEELVCEITDYTPEFCGIANGTATVFASGGTPPYDYLWSDGQTTATAIGLAAGYYTVLITDANGCEVTCEVTIPEEPCVCETAYARLEDGLNECFLDANVRPKFNNWGWTNLIPEAGEYVLPLYAGAAHCNPANGEWVGNALISYSNDGNLVVEYDIFEGYSMTEAHINVGCDKYPKLPNGRPTVAPGQYTYKKGFDDYVSSYTVTFVGVSGPVWVIVHAVVCNYPYGIDGGGATMVLNLDCLGNKALSDPTPTDASVDVSNEFKVYPNPFTTNATFEFVSDRNAPARLEIYNAVGQKLATLIDQVVEQGVIYKLEYQPADVIQGVLIYRLTLGNEVIVGRLIQQ